MNRVAGDIFACRAGYRVPDLLERNVVFEFDGLRTDLQDFLMELLFAAVYEYRLANTHRDGDLRHVFFLDEGKRVFSVYKERSNDAGIPHVTEVTAKMREFGEALIVADQEPAKLSDSITANTYTKVLLPIGDAKQLNRVAASMNLSDRQQRFAHSLGVGQGLVRVGNDEAVPVQFSEYSIEKSVDDAELLSFQRQQWRDLALATGQDGETGGLVSSNSGDATTETGTQQAADTGKPE
jgi:hypothetical protein